MKRMLLIYKTPLALLLIATSAILTGCPNTAAETQKATAPAKEEANAPAPMGGIAIPAAVRDNLGITFAKVERRRVSATRRLPGQFELRQEARQEYRALMAGRVSLRVAQFQAVQPGDILLTLDSPEWRRLQHETVEAEGDIVMTQATLEVAQAQRNEANAAVARKGERIDNLAKVNVRRAELEADAANMRNSLPRLEAEIRAQEAALREAHEHYASRLNALSSVTGQSVEELRKEVDGVAAWRGISSLEIRARSAGVVEALSVVDGGWLEPGELALSVIDPTALRFHAEAPQGDITLFSEGQQAVVTLSQGSAVSQDSSMSGTLVLGLTAHPTERTISVYLTPDIVAPWAKAGISAYLEVTVSTDAPERMAIPLAAVIQDGLERIYFRRDPKNPDRALRVVADLGEDDGRWIAVKSGVKEGDEVVLEGVYALKLTDSGESQAPDGYHYHADGALHKNH